MRYTYGMTTTANTASHVPSNGSLSALWLHNLTDVDVLTAVRTDIDYLASVETLDPPMDPAYGEYLDAVDDYIDRHVDVL